MIPAIYYVLDEFPLTANGKVDRTKLVQSSNAAILVKNLQHFPTDPLQARLCVIWRQVLSVQTVGIQDNFFALGGDSIIAIQIAAKAREYGILLAVKDLFDCPTIAGLSTKVKKIRPTWQAKKKSTGYFDFTPIQHWFFELNLVKREQFSQICAIEFNTTVDVVCLENCLKILFFKYDAFRLRFTLRSQRWQQFYIDSPIVEHPILTIVELNQQQLKTLEEDICIWGQRLQQNFDLTYGSLFKAVLIKTSTLSARLLIAVHHLIIDGVSWHIFCKDLERIYVAQQGNDKKLIFNQVPSILQAWSNLLRQYAKSARIKATEHYWLTIKQNNFQLPVDYITNAPNLEKSAKTVTKSLTKEETSLLLNQAVNIYQVRFHELLIATLVKTLAQWSQQANVLIDLEGHGREEELAKNLDLSQTIGWFTALFPIYLSYHPTTPLTNHLNYVARQLRTVPERGLAYGILRYLKDKANTIAVNPAVSFNYWGQFSNIFSRKSLFAFKAVQLISHPQNQRSHLLNIEALIDQDQLKITWRYSTKYHKRQTIQKLAMAYSKNLQLLIQQFFKMVSRQATAQWPLFYQDPIEHVYLLTPMQKGLLFHGVYAETVGTYIVQAVWQQKAVNLILLHQACQILLERHAILRTYFKWEGLAEPIQIVQRIVKLPWQTYCGRSNNTDPNYASLTAFLQADRKINFIYDKAPLWRVTVFKEKLKKYIIFTCHHILLDGWSLGMLLQELGKIYQALLQGQYLRLLKAPVYAHYVQWLQQQDLALAHSFWTAYLAGFIVPSHLGIVRSQQKLDYAKPADFASESSVLPSTLTKNLQHFCQKNNLTLSSLFQGIWAILLSRYLREEEVIFGVTLSGRTPRLPDIEKMLGLMINTLPLRISLSGNPTALNFLATIQENIIKISHYFYTPLTLIQSCSAVPPERQLFESLVVVENYPIKKIVGLDINFNEIRIIDPTHYPLSLVIVPGERLVLKFNYDKNRIADDMLLRLMGHVQTLLKGILSRPYTLIQQLNLLTAAEWQQMIVEWNDTKTIYPHLQTVSQLFEEQVKKTPQRIALVFGNQTFSYQQLNQKANQLARYLRKRGVKNEDLVALCLERGFEMVVGILAILKAGGAYVPIDPDYPVKRIQYMLQDSHPKFMLSNSNLRKKIKYLNFPYSDLINLDKLKINTESINNLNIKQNLKNIIYVIYTSGSTGQPKGVINTHLGVANRLLWAQATYPLSIEESVLQKTPFSFDVSVWEFFWPLIAGARLVLAQPGMHKDIQYLQEIIIREKISTMHFVPSMLSAFLQQKNLGRCISLKKVICSGETLTSSIVKTFYKKFSSATLYNFYGPTEAAIEVTAWECSKLMQKTIPIGKPIANTQLYILDRHLNPLPVGIIGELYIGGLCLAKGYLNQKKLTAAAFISYPLQKKPENKLYKTGDLAYWLPDGNLVYSGRSDSQVKIRGFRIELEEIEQNLQKYPNIKQAIVMVDYSKNAPVLIAYLVLLKNQFVLEIENIRAFLEKYLPIYMIPAAFVWVKQLPLTINGKIDRQVLARLAYQPVQRLYVAPRTPLESALVDLWVGVLQTSKIGITDNFFELGGHSLLALQLLGKINRVFRMGLKVRSLFDYPTIAKLALYIEAQRQEQVICAYDPAESSLIYLKSNGYQSPVFLIHPVGGTIFWYSALAKYMRSDHPLYAIQDPGLDRVNKIPFNTVEEMAEFYVKLIKRTQHQGPYYLGGASSGATVSMAVAYQLQQLGEKIAFLGLLDGWAPYPDLLLSRAFFEANMRRQYYNMQEKFVLKNILKTDILIKLQWRRLRMYADYQVPRVDFKLTLFKAEDTILAYRTVEDGCNHWEHYTVQPIERYLVPGDHETMFQEPQVATLSQKLNACLENL